MKKIFFTLLLGTALLASCNDNDTPGPDSGAGKYKNGTFILNEGNMTKEAASLIFISTKGEVTGQAYYTENGTNLGNTSQDLCIANGKIYIISQNGGNDGMLVVANAETLKKEDAYTKEELGLTMPTHIAVTGQKAYIRHNSGISVLDLTTRQITAVNDTKGAAKNRMAIVGSKVFVPAGKSVFVLQDGVLVHTIAYEGAVSGVIRSYDNNLWVSCTTSPAQINKVSATDYSTLGTHTLGSFQVGAGYGASPAISAVRNNIYFSNATTKICRHNFTTDTTEELANVADFIDNAGIVYNNLAADPATGLVYFNTIKSYAEYNTANDITVFDFSGATPVMKADYQNYTSFPAGIFFTADFK